MFKLFNEQKGSALATVIIVSLVLSLLILALSSVTMVDFKQKAFQNSKMQAFYLAKTGAEVTLQAWVENELYYDPVAHTGEVEPVYLTTNKTFVNTQPQDYIGYFEVEVAYNQDTEDTIFTSVGFSKGVEEKVILTLSESGEVFWSD